VNYAPAEDLRRSRVRTANFCNGAPLWWGRPTVIQGRDDNRAVPEQARAFLQKMRAPSKAYTAIDGGHFACFDNPADFLNALDNDLRSVSIGAHSTS